MCSTHQSTACVCSWDCRMTSGARYSGMVAAQNEEVLSPPRSTFDCLNQLQLTVNIFPRFLTQQPP